jgi:hypothetical protein
VVGTVLRARRHGHEVLIGSNTPDAIESVAVLEEFDVRVIDIGEHEIEDEDGQQILDPDRRCRLALASVAREQGYPGLIYQADPTSRIDFEASEEALIQDAAYQTTAIEHPVVGPEPRILVAIPAYNEAATIGDVVRAAREHATDVLVVDDGSDDETATRAAQAGAAVIQHQTNRGYGAALQTAFDEANRSDAAHLVIIDGDGQHETADIDRLVETQQESEAEVVIGSRLIDGARTDMPLYRRFGLAVVNWTTNISFGAIRSDERIVDTQSGFRAYSSDAIESLANADELGTSMGASTDIIHHAQAQGFSFEEVPTTIDYDVENGSSQHPLSHGFSLISNLLQAVEREHPVLFLGVPGFASSVLGLGVAYATIVNFTTTGTFSLGLGMVSVFFILIGVFSCFTAIILHSLNQLHNP